LIRGTSVLFAMRELGAATLFLPAASRGEGNEGGVTRHFFLRLPRRHFVLRHQRQATALMTLPTFSMTSPISSSLMISGGVSASVSPAMRSIKSLSWKAETIAS
jgi:hypothetical protein